MLLWEFGRSFYLEDHVEDFAAVGTVLQRFFQAIGTLEWQGRNHVDLHRTRRYSTAGTQTEGVFLFGTI